MTNTKIIKNRLLKTMVLAVLALFTFSLSACDSDDLDYSDFAEDHLDTWKDVTDKEEDQYLIYYYGVNCSHCKTIKQDILGFANYNEAELQVYFIESSDVSYENYEMYPVLDPQTGEKIPGTPTIVVITDGEVKAMAVGPTIIRDLLSQINKGTYGFIK